MGETETGGDELSLMADSQGLKESHRDLYDKVLSRRREAYTYFYEQLERENVALFGPVAPMPKDFRLTPELEKVLRDYKDRMDMPDHPRPREKKEEDR